MYSHLLIPILIAFIFAVNMGGSGTGPSFSVAYGANVIPIRFIPTLFGIMVFIGVIVAGKATTTTMGKELLPPQMMTTAMVSVILISVTVSLLIANLAGIPQSTSQSTVLAITAPAVYFHVFKSDKLFFEIIPAWFILPILSFFICFLLAKYFYRPLRKKGYTLSKELNTHPALRYSILAMSLYVAFSIGANNVANAAGPIASMAINELSIHSEKGFLLITILATLVVAPGFGIGSSLFGPRIVKNTGKEIVLFGPIEAIIIAFVSASLLLFASVTKGIPTSLVQLNVAAILGIGVAKLGFKNIFKKTEVNRFFVMWVISPTIAFGLSFLLVFLFDKMSIF